MEEKKNKSRKKNIWIVAIALVIIVVVSICIVLANSKKSNNELAYNETEEQKNVDSEENTEQEENSETEEMEQKENDTKEESDTEEQEEKGDNKKEDNKNEKNDKSNQSNKNESTQTENVNKKEDKTVATTPTPTPTPSAQENITDKDDSNENNVTTPIEETKPYLVKTEQEKQLSDTVTKYGVVINTYTITTYNVYSDESKVATNTTTKTEYDRSNYSATTAELLAEARTARSKYSGMISQVVTNVNTYRTEANNNLVDGISDRTSLVLDEQLCVAANVRAVEMAYSAKFSHTRPNGTSCFTVINEMGISYSSLGENIASGQTSANSVSTSWKNSPGHYSNMISEKFSKIGVGVYKLDGAYYWVQLFSN